MSKANDLVLYRGAIPGADPVNEAGEQRGPIQVRANYVMGLFIGVNQIAGELRSPRGRGQGVDGIRVGEFGVPPPLRPEAEVERDLAAWLDGRLFKIDGSSIDARWRPRFQSSQGKTEAAQALRQLFCGKFSRPPCGIALIADDDPSGEGSAGSEDDVFPFIYPADVGLSP